MSEDILARVERIQQAIERGGAGRAALVLLVPALAAELKAARAQLRQVARQTRLFLDDGERNRLIVVLAIAEPDGETTRD